MTGTGIVSLTLLMAGVNIMVNVVIVFCLALLPILFQVDARVSLDEGEDDSCLQRMACAQRFLLGADIKL